MGDVSIEEANLLDIFELYLKDLSATEVLNIKNETEEV